MVKAVHMVSRSDTDLLNMEQTRYPDGLPVGVKTGAISGWDGEC